MNINILINNKNFCDNSFDMSQIQIHLFCTSKTLEPICSWRISLIKPIIEPIIGVNIKKVVIFVTLILNAPVTALQNKNNHYNHIVHCN